MRAALALASLAVFAACSAASIATVPIVSGTYTMTVYDGQNQCEIAGVTQGSTTTGVPLTVSQAEDAGTPQNMTVVLGGNAGALLTAVMGSNILTGTFGNNQVTLTPETPDSGTTPTGTLNGCTYAANASLVLNFQGDTVQGTMTYTLNLSGNNCAPLYNCTTTQALAGVLTPGDT